MKKLLRAIVALSILNLAGFLLVVYFLMQTQPPKPKVPVTKPTAKPQNGIDINPSVSPGQGEKTTPTVTKDLFSELGQHNTQGDCWIAYNGHIYDISSYFGSHPGGDSLLLKYCGKDATVGFNTKDMAPGKPHSGAALNMLSQFLIQ